MQLQLQQQTLGLAGDHQYGNATLAMVMCRRIFKLRNIHNRSNQELLFSNSHALKAFAEASWPARCQTVHHHHHDADADADADASSPLTPLTLRLDGAHTIHSLTTTMEWYQTQTQSQATTTTTPTTPLGASSHYLLFNCSHERNPLELLSILSQTNTGICFEHVYFCTSDFGKPSPIAMPTASELLQQAGMVPLPSDETVINSSDTTTTTTTATTWQETLATLWKHLPNNKSHGEVTWNVTAQQAMDDIILRSSHNNNNQKKNHPPQVLVTGSLYLVGSVLTAIGWSEPSSRSDIIFPQPKTN